VAEWREIGEIALLQVSRSKLVRNKQFYPEQLAEVDRLRLTPDGVLGLVGGSWILDRHHRQHPAAEQWNANRALLIGFTSHYSHMWDLFRETALGSAGDNVVVRADEMVGLADLAGGIRIRTEHTEFELSGATIAEPCVGFTRFMTDRRDAGAIELEGERDKLRGGVRGFVVGLQGLEFVEITAGDTVSVRAV
jgi:hypothetical protein